MKTKFPKETRIDLDLDCFCVKKNTSSRIISHGLGQVKSLAVDPSHGKLFWSDVTVDADRHVIRMADMDGGHIRDLVTRQVRRRS